MPILHLPGLTSAYISASVLFLMAVGIGISPLFPNMGIRIYFTYIHPFVSSVYFPDYGVLKYAARYVMCCTKLNLQHITLAK